jgi:hypothetical protein
LAAVLGLVGALATLTGPPKLWNAVAEVFSPALPAHNTEVVLDASAAMGGSFGASGTKLEAAAAAIEGFVVPFTNEGLALRRSGGECHESGRLLVDFGEDHADEVRDSAAEQKPSGKSHLANAVIAALDDFADDERFPDPKSLKRVVVFTGTVDGCRGRSAAEDIRRELERTGINAVFKLVGVKVSDNDRARLLSFKHDLGDSAELSFVETDKDLGTVRRWLAERPRDRDCADGVDNDGDRLVDKTEDSGCAQDGTEEPDPPQPHAPTTAAPCAAETGDPGCAQAGTDELDGSQPDGDCSDGVDNDQDGLVDQTDDTECAEDGAQGPDGSQPDLDCTDGLGNNAPGPLDATDPKCADGAEAALEAP